MIEKSNATMWGALESRLARTLLLALIPAFALIAPGTGLAASVDTKSYPAAICQAAGTNQSLDYWWGQVVNRSSRNVIADCPVVKDRLRGISGGGYAQFWALDKNDSRDVRCAFYNFDHSTPEPWRTVRWSAAQTSGRSTRVQSRKMSFDGTWIDGSFLFGCSIPGRQIVYDDVGPSYGYTYSAVVGFKVVEKPLDDSYGTDWD